MLQIGDDSYSNGSHLSPTQFHRAGSTSSDEFSDDLYAFDESAMPHRSHGHRRRSSSVSFSSRPTIIPPGGSPYQPVGSIPIPVNQPSYSYSGGSPYHPGGSPYAGSSPYHGQGTYPQQYPGGMQGVPVVSSSYDPNQAVLYQNPAGSYPQQTYIQGQPGMSQSVPMHPPPTVYIQEPSRHSSSRRKHHKHRSGSRHRSHSDADYSHRY